MSNVQDDPRSISIGGEADTSLRSQRFFISLLFLAAGIGIGSWAASLPSIAAPLHLSNGSLGAVLLCFAVGAIATMTLVGRVIPTFGTRTISTIGACIFGVALIAVPHAKHSATLVVLVLIAGAAFGSLDVAMNTSASFLEARLKRQIMSSVHALYSVGGLLGAGLCGWLLEGGAAVSTCLAVSGVCIIGVAVIARVWWADYVDTPSVTAAAGEARAALGRVASRRVLLLGVLAFLALLCEGALSDWIAIYLVGTIGTSKSTGAFGFAVFACLMAVGRGFGDMANNRFDPDRTLAFGAGAVCIALSGVLLATSLPVIFVGIALCGLGIANIVPTIFAVTGKVGAGAAGIALSRVATMGYAGLLIGPPFIGSVAQYTTLGSALVFVVIAMAIVALCSRLARA